MKVLVTGGTTWFGQAIVGRLLARDHEVATLDEAPVPWRVPLPREVRVHRGSVADLGAVAEVMRLERPAVVVHRDVLYGPETEARYLRTVQVNLIGALNVFQAAAVSAGVRRVVYESSIGVYGLQEEHGPRWLHEDDARFVDPPHVYRLTQHAVEFFARRMRRDMGLEIVGTRPSVCHSPLKDVGISRWSNDCVSLPALGRPMRFPHPASQRTSLVWVDDAAEVYARLADQPTLRHDMYNSGGHDVSHGELAELVRRLIPGAQFEFGDAGAQPLPWRVDHTRARDELGLALRPLSDTLREHANQARALAGLPPLAGT
jgi:nucleoside-diphosphate-sugar epimerase